MLTDDIGHGPVVWWRLIQGCCCHPAGDRFLVSPHPALVARGGLRCDVSSCMSVIGYIQGAGLVLLSNSAVELAWACTLDGSQCVSECQARFQECSQHQQLRYPVMTETQQTVTTAHIWYTAGTKSGSCHTALRVTRWRHLAAAPKQGPLIVAALVGHLDVILGGGAVAAPARWSSCQ